MSTVFTDIEAALNTRLSNISDSPTIAWPNVDFKPTQGITYLRPTLLPASGDLFTLGGVYEHKGLYQIDICCPINQGISELTGWQDAIILLFSVNKSLFAGQNTIFIQNITIGKAERQEGWYVSFITIQYLCIS